MLSGSSTSKLRWKTSDKQPTLRMPSKSMRMGTQGAFSGCPIRNRRSNSTNNTRKTWACLSRPTSKTSSSLRINSTSLTALTEQTVRSRWSIILKMNMSQRIRTGHKVTIRVRVTNLRCNPRYSKPMKKSLCRKMNHYWLIKMIKKVNKLLLKTVLFISQMKISNTMILVH